LRAADLAGTARVFEGTMNRDHIRRVIEEGVKSGAIPSDAVPDVTEDSTFGRPEAVITTTVDVRDHLASKRASMAAHASQISESSFFLSMPDQAFESSFGWEWFIRHGVPDGYRDDDLFAGLD
jgi:LmbE family N-acetylglucosaminyl deacetylase